ncbi:hypothetical protein A3L12_01140 [Thermococcus sp. P6]|nr:hypothetical protein A3L12_01140 [Thermococcus sp. P6]
MKKKFLAGICVVLVLFSFFPGIVPAASANPDEPSGEYFSSLDYFNITVGHAIKYNVVDSYDNLNSTVWAVVQCHNSIKDYDGEDFVFTLNKAYGGSGYFRDCTIGGYTSLRNEDGTNITRV